VGNLTVNAAACAWFLLGAFVVAGMAQTAWFAAPVSRRFSQPVDGGATFRGRRVFGAHKTVRGFIVMIPAAAVTFAALAVAVGDPASAGLWPLTTAGYAGLGACAGFGFMAGELPNSFLKRQLGIAPGARPRHPLGATAQFLLDRIDSGIGMLLAVSAIVVTPAMTWLLVLLVGPSIHWAFSLLMFHLGLKARPA
jgi:CDP-2,3-bis-(O-geranylgeranyl)-sn-glycerol synthase